MIEKVQSMLDVVSIVYSLLFFVIWVELPSLVSLQDRERASTAIEEETTVDEAAERAATSQLQ